MANTKLVLGLGIKGVDEESGLPTDTEVVGVFDLRQEQADKIEQVINSKSFVSLTLVVDEEEYLDGCFEYTDEVPELE